MIGSSTAVLPLPRLPRGTSYVTVTTADTGPALRMQTCGGDYEDYAVPVAFDEASAEGALAVVTCPITVMIRRVGDGFDCTLIGASSAGPRRAAISIGGALELARRGIHCVLRCDSAMLADAS